jgi:hypothetical protein
MSETGQPLSGNVGWPANIVQDNHDQAYISYGKALSPNWIQSGLTDVQFRAIGLAYFANLSPVERVLSPTAPTSQINNPGKGIEPPNAEISVTRNADGSIVGRIPGTSVVLNLPTKTT